MSLRLQRLGLLIMVILAFSQDLAAIQSQSSVPAKIVFLTSKPLDLAVGGKLQLEVAVFDGNNNKLSGLEVRWQLVKSADEAFVYIGNAKNDAKTNSIELVWRPGVAGVKAPAEIQLMAQAGNVFAIAPLRYVPAVPEEVVIFFEPGHVEVQPGTTVTAKVTVRAKEDERLLKDLKVTSEAFVDPDMAKLVKVIGPDKENTITFVGLFADPAKPRPLVKSALVVHAGAATGTLPITFVTEPVSVMWEIIPTSIVADNYGRSIKNDYFALEVTIQNHSGSDIALAGLVFERTAGTQTFLSPVSSYAIVRGSLAKRKLTHPRTLTLGIVDGVGSLMTGFVPSFHNDAHKANFSSFIDIISNPLAKGLAAVWKDAYPDEVARFDQDVLKDDKNIPNDSTYRTRIFYPKRLLFKDKDPKRDDANEVRNALGKLVVMGYKFQRGSLTKLSQ